METQPTPSTTPSFSGEYPKKPEEELFEFKCSICSLTCKCKFGALKFEKMGYTEEVYYMRDPFEPPNIHKNQKDYTVDDFLVIGANCYICNQQICIDEECGLFYNHYYCLTCTTREILSFPKKLQQSIEKFKLKE